MAVNASGDREGSLEPSVLTVALVFHLINNILLFGFFFFFNSSCCLGKRGVGNASLTEAGGTPIFKPSLIKCNAHIITGSWGFSDRMLGIVVLIRIESASG